MSQECRRNADVPAGELPEPHKELYAHQTDFSLIDKSIKTLSSSDAAGREIRGGSEQSLIKISRLTTSKPIQAAMEPDKIQADPFHLG